MAYYSTHSTSHFLLNNDKQRVRFLLAHPVYTKDCARGSVGLLSKLTTDSHSGAASRRQQSFLFVLQPGQNMTGERTA